jgi:hypothetical protein
MEHAIILTSKVFSEFIALLLGLAQSICSGYMPSNDLSLLVGMLLIPFNETTTDGLEVIKLRQA